MKKINYKNPLFFLLLFFFLTQVWGDNVPLKVLRREDFSFWGPVRRVRITVHGEKIKSLSSRQYFFTKTGFLEREEFYYAPKERELREYFYEEGKLLSLKISRNGQSAGLVQLEYNKDALLLRQRHFDETARETARYQLKYKDGLCISIGQYQFLDDVYFPWKKFDYDAAARLLQVQVFSNYGDLQRQEKYFYDDAGKLLRKDISTGADNLRVMYEYDEKGRLKSEARTEGKGYYDYNKDGYLVRKPWFYNNKLGEIYLDYDVYGQLREEKYIGAFGNPLKRYVYRTGSLGNLLGLYLFRQKEGKKEYLAGKEEYLFFFWDGFYREY